MRTSHIARTITIFSIGLSGLVSCAEEAPADVPRPAADAGEGPPLATGPSINWNLPYGTAVPTTDSLAEAAADASFDFAAPSFGEPAVIQVVPADLVQSEDDRAVAMIFHLPSEGTILLEVRPAGDFTLDVMKNMVAAREGEAADVAPGADAPASFVPAYQMVPLRGTDALFVQGQGLGRVTWIENGIRYDIMGETATGEEILTLADKL